MIHLALRAHAVANPNSCDDVSMCYKPTGLRAKRDLGKGEIILTPFVSPAYLTDKLTASTIDILGKPVKVDGSQIQLYAGRPPHPKDATVAAWGRSDTCNPYFFVQGETELKKCNVGFKVIREGDVTILV